MVAVIKLKSIKIRYAFFVEDDNFTVDNGVVVQVSEGGCKVWVAIRIVDGAPRIHSHCAVFHKGYNAISIPLDLVDVAGVLDRTLCQGTKHRSDRGRHRLPLAPHEELLDP